MIKKIVEEVDWEIQVPKEFVSYLIIKLAVALLIVPVQLRRCFKIHPSKALFSAICKSGPFFFGVLNRCPYFEGGGVNDVYIIVIAM
jgi:hypothetical protein